ncbi:MAG: ester cyclase [Chlamydiae bacterium]|nr:ester cyclase [Chlamydiota bacterium]MBI3266818.1 ester cyclase [Chlamydiota bacterium]
MFTLDLTQLTPHERAMVDLWERHVKAEFEDKNAAASCDTMVKNPYVNHVPTLVGGSGRKQLEHFYGKYFIPNMPADVETELISRTVGQTRVVDEFIFRCTHTTPMDWLLPGIPPTGKRLELVFVAIISFENGKIHDEHIHLRDKEAPTRRDGSDFSPHQYFLTLRFSSNRILSQWRVANLC